MVENDKWTKPVSLDGFGKFENAACGSLELKTDESFEDFRVFTDKKHGITRIELTTSK